MPMILNKYFPSEDGPMHVHSALAYINYNNPDTPIYKEYYQQNSNPEPNVLVYFIISFLSLIFSPVITEKLLILVYIILMFLSFKYLLSRISKDNGFILFLFFPFILNYPIHLGFYNFSFSVIVFFTTLGYWIEHFKSLNWKDVVILTLLTSLIFFFHPVSLIMFYLASGGMVLWYILSELQIFQNNFAKSVKHVKFYFGYVLKYIISISPTIILFLLFLNRQGSSSISLHLHGIKYRFIEFMMLSSLYSFNNYELVLSSSLALIIFILVIIQLLKRIKQFKSKNNADSLLFVSLIYFFTYLFAPDAMAGGMMLICRLLLFPFFILLLWLASFEYSSRTKKLISFLGILITITYSIIYTVTYKQIDDQIDEYTSCVNSIAPNSVILHLTGDQRARKIDGVLISDKTASFMNIGGRISYYKPEVELSNMVGWTGYGIVDYRPELNPNVLLHETGIGYYAGTKKILDYPKISHGKIDYIILWNYKYFNVPLQNSIFSKIFHRREENPDEETIEDTRLQLKSGYDLIYTSQTGLLELYKKSPLK
jgi:hypothetical protein